jgi:predicted DNA-binding transcriptional regulator AlpA
MIKKFYRGPQVDEIFGWSPSTRKRKVKSGELRPPVSLGPNMVGWPEEYLEEYRKGLIDAAETEAAEAS